MALTTARADRQIEPRFDQPHAADRRGVDVLLAASASGRAAAARPAAAPAGCRRYPACVRRAGTPGGAGDGQRLHLDHDRPLALHRGSDRRTGHAGATVAEEQVTRIGHADQTVAGHLEQAELVGRTEPVLRGAEQAQRMVTFALERQHGVDDVFEHARAGQRAVLGDVPDEDDRRRCAAWRSTTSWWAQPRTCTTDAGRRRRSPGRARSGSSRSRRVGLRRRRSPRGCAAARSRRAATDRSRTASSRSARRRTCWALSSAVT